MQISFRDVTSSDAQSLAHILVNSNESFRGHIPDQCLKFNEEESAANWQVFLDGGLDEGHSLFLAIASSGMPVGYAWGCPTEDNSDYAGELKQLAVLPDYHRMGIGRHLVREAAQRLAMQSITSMCVHVLEVNPNRAFYEHLGAQYVSQYAYDWDGFVSPMYVYGWPDISFLLS
ncbi:GNAT family N-acetyltransferase [Candidatus Saccharibacteria bacterium]|nr:GNAT family N-acetyltransferase [Candidatus Saccharibacteria bacterium]